MIDVTGSDLSDRFDERDIRELVVDDGSNANVVDISTNSRITVALDDARGEVVAALRKSGRYTDADLEALGGVNASYLKRIVCEIAFLHLLRRRPNFSPQALEAYEKARAGYLKDLQDGNSILSDSDDSITSGRASTDGPSLGEWNTYNMAVDRARGARGYFPPRRPFGWRN